jgi:hypothetical protein
MLSTEPSAGLANVILIYNTLRVLSPALASSCNATGPQTDMEGSGSTGAPEKASVYAPRFAPPAGEKAFEFPAPAPVCSPVSAARDPSVRKHVSGVVPYISHSASSSVSDVSSTRTLLRPTTHRQGNSTDSASTISSISRPITPASQLSLELSVPPLVHQRQRSSDSLSSLPPAPRTARSVLRREPSVPSLPPTLMIPGSAPGQMVVLDQQKPISRMESIASLYLSRPSVQGRASYLTIDTAPRKVSMGAMSYKTLDSPSEYGSPLLGNLMRQQSNATLLGPPQTPRAHGSQPLGPAAWASLVTTAATSDGRGMASPSFMAYAQRQQPASPESRDVPAVLRPRAGSAAARRPAVDLSLARHTPQSAGASPEFARTPSTSSYSRSRTLSATRVPVILAPSAPGPAVAGEHSQ